MVPVRPPILALALAVAMAGALPEAAAKSERDLPAKFRASPYHLMSLSVGHPNRGWQVRAKKLRRSAFLGVKAGSEDRVYGHPALVLMLERTAKQVGRQVKGAKMLVGDLSSKSGGALSGHRSHQSGRDADVGFYVRDARGRLTLPDRFVAFGADGNARDGGGFTFDDATNWMLVRTWLRDARAGISHIFVSRDLRKRILAHAAKQSKNASEVQAAAALLKQPEEASAHDDHFHVRITCPKRQEEICRPESAD